MNEAGDFFGDERLLAVVGQSAGLAAEAIGARVLDAVAAFVGDAVPNDDLSLIVLKRA
jgi:serine phosphatase RsbU (regulator of sigma subunit)